ncbi:odorant receptor 4-like isoform X2 [Linepithema humile]|uniref:odorant receptor 4-like isoform X2 n=1 Tax=Linepithema humile TaxID=83485 RepID=UPI0006238FCE|nr:PREDICTED: odorant receptor 4-like [Linepithema humile]
MDVDQFFLNSHYKLCRTQLSISGLWPFQSKIRRYATYFALILLLASGFFVQLMGVIEVRYDSVEVIDSLPMLNMAVVMLFKVIYAMYTLSQIKLLLIKMQEYCLSPKSDEEHQIHNSYTQFGQKIGYLYTYIILGHSVAYNLAPLLTKLMHKPLEENVTSSNKMIEAQVGVPYRVNYMVDLDTYYVPIFIHMVTYNVYNVFIVVTFDVFYISLVEHCRGVFAAFRYRLENACLIENDSNASTKTSTKDKSYVNVAYSIRRHAETIQFVGIMNSVYSPPLFIHVGITILTISAIGYQVMTNTQNINRTLKNLSYMNAILMNVFFENWQGQKIIDSSEKIFESAYNVEWYNLPIAARKLLVLVMRRSMQPLVLTAGKFMVLSYITFNAVIRTSSSYFMLLRSVS